MKFLRKSAIFLGLICLLLTSCSNVKVSYRAKVKTKNQKNYSYTFEKSYKVAGIQVLCIITGIFYGGACWAYLGMPTSGQSKNIRKDAQVALTEKLGANNFTVADVNILRRGWNKVEPSYSLVPYQAGQKYIEKSIIQHKAKSIPEVEEAEPVEEFLR